MASGGQEILVSSDIGGTFTDLVALGETAIHVRKILTSRDDYTKSVIAGVTAAIDQIGGDGRTSLARLVHATTVATNALLEHRGARVGLITTKGFRDVLEITRMRRPTLYDLSWTKPVPLVRRILRQEVTERIDARGNVVVSIDRHSATAAVEFLLEREVEAIAVCLLNSHANDEHERVIGAIVAALAPDVYVSLSTEILARIKEYERTSTTVVNAYLGPSMNRYIEKLEAHLSEMESRPPLLLMQSNGGLVPAEVARVRPSALIESGPAAGALAVGTLAQHLREPNLIGLDIGGTTAKACVIEHGRPREALELEVGSDVNLEGRLLRGSGYAVSLPSIDLAEVGAGGGSIAQIDAGGALKVGPRSAGSVPGPVCYGLGGTEPTVTDAFAVLGFLGEAGIAGGERRVDREAAQKAVAEIASKLELDVHDAAWGIFQVATATMVRAVRAVTSERGRDPRTLTLVGFGGAGPVHSVQLAEQLGIRRAVIPLFPGVFSSLGLLLADLRFDFVSTIMRRSDTIDATGLLRAGDALRQQAAAARERLHLTPQATEEEWMVECRYEGQSAELAVFVEPFDGVDQIIEEFALEHERTFGNRGGGDVLITSMHLRLRSHLSGVRYADLFRLTNPDSEIGAAAQSRRVYFGRDVGHVDTPVMRRTDLREPMTGPLIVEEYDTNVVVPPSWNAALDASGNIVLTSEAR